MPVTPSDELTPNGSAELLDTTASLLEFKAIAELEELSGNDELEELSATLDLRSRFAVIRYNLTEPPKWLCQAFSHFFTKKAFFGGAGFTLGGVTLF